MSDATRLALSIPDVLEEIFSHFVPTRPWEQPFPLLDISELSKQLASVDRRSLARCALVCKAWSPFALDLLWVALPDGIGPLFSVIPDHKRFGHESTGVRGSSGDRHIPEGVWQRFQQYALRVKCLVYKRRFCDSLLDCIPAVHWELSEVQLDLATPLLRHLCEKNGGQPLLSNLRILQWTSSTAPARGLALRLLTGPRLTAFYIGSVECGFVGFKRDSDDGVAAVEGDLATLRVTCPRLEHIHISGTYICEFNPNVDRLALGWANLRSAKFDGVIGNAMVPALARLPRLEVMDVELCSDHSIGNLPESDAFSALRELTARGSTLNVGPLVRSVASERLSSLKLLVSAPSRRDVVDCLQPLPLLPCAGSLVRLQLDMEDLGHDDAHLMFSVLLRPLLSIPHLEDVTLNLIGVKMTNDDPPSIAAAWPLLRRLKVRSDLEEHWRGCRRASEPLLTRPSLLSIVDLAMRRPMLEELSMQAVSVSHREFEEVEEMAQHATPQTNLVLFDCSLLVSGRLTAALSRLFPHAALSSFPR